MAMVYYPIKLNVKPSQYPLIRQITLVQGDTANVFAIELQENRSPFNIEKCTVTATFKKEDTNVVVLRGNIVDDVNGIVHIPILSQVVTYPGKVYCTIEVYNENNLRLTSIMFEFNVVEQLSTDEEITSTTEYTILQELIEDIQLINVAEEQRVQNENTRIANEEDRQSAFNNIINTANTTKSGLDASIIFGNELKAILDDKITIGNNVKSNLFESIVDANNSKSDLDGSIDNSAISKTNLDDSVFTANNVKTALDGSISEGSVLKGELNDIIIGTDYEHIMSDIASLKQDQHVHTNKDTLDGLSDVDGKLKYNGQDVGIGDMTKSEYDVDGDGKVDIANDSEKLGGQLPNYYAKVTDVPTKTSQLINDSDFETTLNSQDKSNIAEQNAKNYTNEQLLSYAKIIDVNTKLDKKIDKTEKGVANGLAELDSGGKVPSSQLPSYVDDVLEFSSKSIFPTTGETGKIYVAIDTNLTYRWSGTEYIEISPSIALGETSSTAYRGDRGKIAYDHSQLIHDKNLVGLGNVDNTSDLDKPISTAMLEALNNKVNNSRVLTDVPANAKFTDTITPINDTLTSTSTTQALSANQGKALDDKIDNLTTDLVAHKAEKATQDGYGHIRLQDIPNPEVATQAEAEAGTNNTKMMTPLRVSQAIDSKVRVVDSDLLEINIGGELKLFSLTPVAFIDNTNAPGSKYAIAGDWNAGYFGEVSSRELITGDALASQVGISAGTSQFSNAGWLKFAYKGNIQFVAKKTFRHSISWNDINTVGCVFGNKTVVIGGLTYKVRLMRAGTVDPMASYNGANNHGSEWNRLMLPIHIEAKDKSWAYPDNVEADIPYWGIDFTDEDLHTHNSFGSGSYSWCQETYSSNRVVRGSFGVSGSFYISPSSTSSVCGWRPVLELVAEL